jgi:hypothetical protein
MTDPTHFHQIGGSGVSASWWSVSRAWVQAAAAGCRCRAPSSRKRGCAMNRATAASSSAKGSALGRRVSDEHTVPLCLIIVPCIDVATKSYGERAIRSIQLRDECATGRRARPLPQFLRRTPGACGSCAALMDDPTSHLGLRPLPAQVSDGFSGLRYLGATAPLGPSRPGFRPRRAPPLYPSSFDSWDW